MTQWHAGETLPAHCRVGVDIYRQERVGGGEGSRQSSSGIIDMFKNVLFN